MTYRSYLEKFVLFLFFKFNLFRSYFWLFRVLVAARELSPVEVSRGSLQGAVLIALASLGERSFRSAGFGGRPPVSSVVVAQGLSCSKALGLFLDRGSNACPLRRQADSWPLHLQGSPGFILDSFPRQTPYGPWGRPLLSVLLVIWICVLGLLMVVLAENRPGGQG